MAKKERPTPAQKVAEFLKNCTEGERQNLGDVCGVPVPSLAFMWLIAGNVLPLGKGVGLAGPYQSSKSTLGFELMRWLTTQPVGLAHYVETEGGKVSRDLASSLMREGFERMLSYPADSIEVAQACIMKAIEKTRLNEDRDYSVGVLLDSLSGANTDNINEDVVKSGFASQDFSRAASLWTTYLKTAMNRMAGWPVTLIYVNHLKDAINAPRPGMKTTPGGKAQYFHAALYLWIRKVAESERKTWSVDGEDVVRPTSIRHLRIVCEKNSLAVDGRAIDVDLCWYHALDGNQVTFFNWLGADAKFLSEHQGDYGIVQGEKGPRYGKLSELVDVSVSDKRYVSKRLKVSAVEGHELGLKLHGDKELYARLQSFLCIKQHRIWPEPMPEMPPEKAHEEAPVRNVKDRPKDPQDV